MRKFLLFMIVATFGLIAVAQEQAVELRSDHPQEYIVQEGDTLWDIAGRFLARPWQWPAIWQANPQIENPHLIYPGDRISLVYVDGQPRLMVDRTRRLSPEIRREPVSGPIRTIPLSAIEPFLTRPRVMDADELAALPYVVANQDTRFAAAEPERTFVRGLDGVQPGSQVVIARLNYQFEDVERSGRRGLAQNRIRGNLGAVPSGERPIPLKGPGKKRAERVIGYQLWEVARAEVLTLGDPAQLKILDADFEVRAGDYVLPLDDYLYDLTFQPRAPDFTVPDGVHVIGIHGGDHSVGEYQIVALDIGAEDGVAPGHTFSVFHPGDRIKDPFYDGLRGRPAPKNVDGRQVRLPEQFAGTVMVFRAFDRVSYALVMDTTTGIQVGDHVDHPDRRL
ncbi:MAG: LysM peptidoglycan-binding domain-containing protein [Wenzhouxiangellaceae bacterium]